MTEQTAAPEPAATVEHSVVQSLSAPAPVAPESDEPPPSFDDLTPAMTRTLRTNLCELAQRLPPPLVERSPSSGSLASRPSPPPLLQRLTPVPHATVRPPLPPPQHPPRVSTVMKRSVAFVEPEDTARTAASVLREWDTSTLPVCVKQRLVGVVSARDLAFHVVADDRSANMAVGQLMCPPRVWAYADESTAEVFARMQADGAQNAPILDREHRLVGMVSWAELSGRTPPRHPPPPRRPPSSPGR